MRRRLLWAVVVVVALVAVFLGSVMVLGRGESQFAFLNGHKLIQEKGTPRSAAPEQRLYSFEADFESLKSKASAELTALGFEDITRQMLLPEDRYAAFARGDVSALMAYYKGGGGTTAFDANVETVMLMRNWRFRADPAPGEPASGWVAVSLGRTGEASLFDKLRAWLGF